MTSSIDATKPATGVAVSKSAQRANWQAAKTEIQFLQARPRLLTAQTITPPATLAAFNFTGIATAGWSLRKIEIGFSDLSTDATQHAVMQIGPSGALETADYRGTFRRDAGGRNVFTSWFGILHSPAAGTDWQGTIFLTLIDPATNLWSYFTHSGRGDSDDLCHAGGKKALAGDLDQLSIFPASGNFDGGTVNCMVWEVQ